MKPHKKFIRAIGGVLRGQHLLAEEKNSIRERILEYMQANPVTTELPALRGQIRARRVGPRLGPLPALLPRVPHGPHRRRNFKGVMNRAEGKVEKARHLLLGVTVGMMRDGFIEKVVPDCFDFLHSKTSIFR